VRLRIGGDGDARVVDLGTTTIIGGTVTIAPIRLWSDPPRPTDTALAPVVAARDGGRPNVVIP
jgi:hypothetical protein